MAVSIKKYSSIDNNLEDNELILKAQNGCEESNEFLLKKYKSLVKLKAQPYFIMGGDYEDLVQEGLIGLYKAIRDYLPKKQIPFRAFAEICITRQIITAIKTANRQKHLPLNYYISLHKPVYSVDDTDRTWIDVIESNNKYNPEVLVANKDELDGIMQTMNRILSDFEFKVFDLYINKSSYREIANILKTSTKAVDNALCRIKRKINLYLTA